MSRARDARLLWAATLAFFVALYALFVPMVPRLEALGIRGQHASLVLGSFAVAALVGRPLAGSLVDRGGARRASVAGALLLGLGGIGFATGTSAPALLLARAAQGLAYAIFTTAGYTIAGMSPPPGRRAVVLARLGTATNVALALTPSAVAAAQAWLTPSGVALVAAGVAAVAAALAAAVADGGARPPRCAARASPLPSPVERLPVLRAALSGVVFGTFAQLTQRDAGAIFVVFGVGILATRVLLGRLPAATLTRPRAPFVLIALGLTLLIAPVPLSVACGAALLVAVGLGILMPTLLALQHELRPETARGSATAVYYLGFDLGLGVASGAIGLSRPPAAYALAALAAAVGAILSPPPRSSPGPRSPSSSG